MTVQLELDFTLDYVYEAINDLRSFAVVVSRTSFKQNYIFRYRNIERQASDLKSYAFLQGYIDFDEWYLLTGLMNESSSLFWSV